MSLSSPPLTRLRRFLLLLLTAGVSWLFEYPRLFVAAEPTDLNAATQSDWLLTFTHLEHWLLRIPSILHSLLIFVCSLVCIFMISFVFQTFLNMDLYSTLNSLAPNFYLSMDCPIDPLSEVVYDFPPSDEPVYILGRKYSSLHELSEIRSDVRSIIWVTYRRNFPPIGDSSHTADSGWGCMLRTGQMVLAQAFAKLHLGRDWRWRFPDSISVQKLLDEHLQQSAINEEESSQASASKKNSEYDNYIKYRQILKLFADLKTAPYSIHQIALMGQCEGKTVGEWFGPNTVAQVLKKLSIYDKFNDVHVHVAMDNMVFIDDIKKFCKSKIRLESVRMSTMAAEATDLDEADNFWRPVILFIPLRLGLTEINPVYKRAIKSTFALPQTLGILGGRPNHALYFVGCCGDDLVYLDPHTTQQAIQLSDDLSEFVTSQQLIESEEGEESACSIVMELDDISYHCESARRMPISFLDPSIALCFLARTEEEFDQWANLTMKKLIQEEQQPLFEIMKERPQNWPCFEEDFDLQVPNGQSSASPSTSVPKSSTDSNANNNKHSKASTSAANVPSDSFTALESDEDFEIID